MKELDAKSELHNLLTSYFQLDTITKVNYNQYIGTNGNEQWCFQADLYLRSRDNRTLVSLFSKELWCFSLNDDPVPLPYEKRESFSSENSLSFLDKEIIDTNIIQERIPDKVGHFTPNFAKPNLPTPYAIFLKAVRRLIYLNLCSLSLNKYTPFGNSCLIEDKYSRGEFQILNFSPHLFDDGSLSVSINYKNLKLSSLKQFLEQKKLLDDNDDDNGDNHDGDNESSSLEYQKDLLDNFAVYIAPSSVKCTVKFTSNTLKSCISSKPPKNSDKVLKILSISHGLDLIERKDEIKWIKIVPSILHLSGQTPPIAAYLKDQLDETSNSCNTILWPLDLLYLQSGEDSLCGSKTETTQSLSLDDTFQMISELSDLNSKLSLSSKPVSENLVIMNESEPVESADDAINTNIPLLQNHSATQHSSPFLMSMGHGSPDKLTGASKSIFSIASLQNNANSGVNLISNQIASPFFKMKSMESSPAFGFIEKELFKNNDPNKSVDEDIAKDHEELVKYDEPAKDEIKDDEDLNSVDDEMRDLFGDDDDDEDADISENKSVHEAFDATALSNKSDDEADISVQVEETKKGFGHKRAFDLIDSVIEDPKSTGYSYFDPGAPVPASNAPTTAMPGNNIVSNFGAPEFSRDRRSSVYSHINFNPLIESVDNKYKQGGKFSSTLLQNNVNDHLFNHEDNSNNANDENSSTPGGINLQEIMFQASRKINNGGNASEYYEEETSSDEDDNGMISIRDISKTNIAVPLTSISHNNQNSQQHAINNVDPYQSLPYTNLFSTSNNNNNNNIINNSAKVTGSFPLSVVNDLENTDVATKDLKNIFYPLSVPSTVMLNETHNQNNLLSGNELYKGLSQTKNNVPGFSSASNASLGAGLNQKEFANTEVMDNLMAKITSSSLLKQAASSVSPEESHGKNFIDEMLLSNAAKSPSASILEKKTEIISPINSIAEKDSAEEDKNINVLPFVLRHMPVFSIPFHFYNDISNKIDGVDDKVFFETFEKELMFNFSVFNVDEKKDLVYCKENIFYEPSSEIENIFQRLFPKFNRLMLGKDLLVSDKLLGDAQKEQGGNDDNKVIIVNNSDGNELLVEKDVLRRWEQYNLQPVLNEIAFKNQNDIYACFISITGDESAKMIMRNFSHMYQSRKFGQIKLLNEQEDGVITLDTFNKDCTRLLILKIIKHFVGIKNKANLVLMFSVKNEGKKAKNEILAKLKYFTLLKAQISEMLPLLSLDLQLVPESQLHFIKMHDLNQMGLSVFNKINSNQEKSKVHFAKLLPKKNLHLKGDVTNHNYAIPIVTNNNIPYFNVPKNNTFDNYIIVSYSRSIDKKYITASWILPDGTNFSFKTWKLDDSSKFEKVCDEVWAKTIQLIKMYSDSKLIGDSNCIILTRLNSVLPDDELMHWRRLSSKNKNVSLAVVCVGFNRSSKGFNDALSSHSYSTNTLSNNTHFLIFKHSLPLSNSQHRCSIKTGAILKTDGDTDSTHNLSLCDYLEVNLLNCPHSASSILLEIIMKQYHDLSLLNPCFGISYDTVIPFNLLLIERVLNRAIHLDI